MRLRAKIGERLKKLASVNWFLRVEFGRRFRTGAMISALIIMFSPIQETKAKPNLLEFVRDKWRFPSPTDIRQKEYKVDWEWSLADGRMPFFTMGDFDGNGVTDIAWILVRANDAQDWGAFVFLMREDGVARVEKIDEKHGNFPPFFVGIGTKQPGEFVRACAKGYGEPCKEGEGKVKLEKAAVVVMRYEATSSVYLWSEEDEEFRRYKISD